jgi:hypothetical protein
MFQQGRGRVGVVVAEEHWNAEPLSRPSGFVATSLEGEEEPAMRSKPTVEALEERAVYFTGDVFDRVERNDCVERRVGKGDSQHVAVNKTCSRDLLTGSLDLRGREVNADPAVTVLDRDHLWHSVTTAQVEDVTTAGKPREERAEVTHPRPLSALGLERHVSVCDLVVSALHQLPRPVMTRH